MMNIPNLRTLSRKLLLLGASLAFVLGLQAQNGLQVADQPSPVTVCLGETDFSLVFRNMSETTTYVNIRIPVNLPEGVTFTGIVEGAGLLDGDPGHPVFKIEALAPGQMVTVTYQVKAACSLIDNVLQNEMVKHTIPVLYWEDEAQTDLLYTVETVSYDVRYAELTTTILNGNYLPSVSVGEVYGPLSLNRRLQVLNSGNGAVGSLQVRIMPEPAISYTKFYGRDGVTEIPFTTNGTTGEITLIIDSEIMPLVCVTPGSDEFLLEENEMLEILEEFRVIGCDEGNTQYVVEWGCNNEFCNAAENNAQGTSNVDTPPVSEPEITYTTGNGTAVANYCGQDGDLTFTWQNAATEPANYARNLVLAIAMQENNAVPQGFELYDFKINNEPVAAVYDATLERPDGETNYAGYVIDLNANTTAAYNINDADNDGFMDDLPAGGSVTVTARIRFLPESLFLASCPDSYVGVFGLPQAKWETQCGFPVFTSAAATNYSASTASISAGDIEGPGTFEEGTTEAFRFCTGNVLSNLGFFNCTVGTYSAQVTIPENYHLSGGVTWESAAGDSYPISNVTDQGTTILIGGGGTSAITPSNWRGCYVMNISLDPCDDPNPDEGGEVSWRMDYKCGPCEKLMPRGCDAACIDNHFTTCPPPVDPHCVGVVPVSTEAERTTFGWTDRSRTTAVTASTPGVRLDAVYPYDEFDMTTTGVVECTDFTDVFWTLDYERGDLEYLGGTFYITRGGNPVADCQVLPGNSAIQTSNVYGLQEVIRIPCLTAANVLPGDDVRFESHWRNLPENINAPGAFKFGIIGGFYADLIPTDPTPPCPDPESIEFYSLGVAGPVMKVSTYGEVPSRNPAGCEVLNMDFGFDPGGIDFPAEFRNTGRLANEVVYHIPEGYTYVPGSAVVNTQDASDVSPYWTLVSSDPITPVISGSDLTFNHTWPLIDQSSVIGMAPMLTFQLQPTCAHPLPDVSSTVEFEWTNYDYADPACHHARDWTNTPAFLPSSAVYTPPPSSTGNVVWQQLLPNLKLNTGLATVEGLDKQVEWLVRLCNIKDAGHLQPGPVDKAWVQLTPGALNVGVLQYLEVTDAQTIDPLSYTVNGSTILIEMAEIGVNECRQARIKVEYGDCEPEATDNIAVLSGWTCGEYPEPGTAGEAGCPLNTDDLQLRYRDARMIVTADASGSGYAICDAIPYEVVIRSTAPGTIYDLDFWLELPEGITLDAATAVYIYPESEAPQALPAPVTDFTGTNPQGWHLSGVIPELAPDGGLTGNRDLTQNKLRLRFNLVSSCENTQLEKVKFHVVSQTNCDDPLERQLDRLLPIPPVTSPDNFKIFVPSAPPLNDNDEFVAIVQVFNENNVHSGINNTLKAIVPVGFEFLEAEPTYPEPDGITSVPEGTELSWSLPELDGGEMIAYSFRIKATVNHPQVTDFSALIVFSEFSPCSPEVCERQITVSENTPGECAGCTILNFLAPSVVCAGADVFLLNISDECSGFPTFSWNFGDGSPDESEISPVHTYGAAGNYTVVLTMFPNQEGCPNLTVERTIEVESPCPIPCEDCLAPVVPSQGDYIISAWVREENPGFSKTSYNDPQIIIEADGTSPVTFTPKGTIIDGWQRVEGVFTLINDAPISVTLKCVTGNCFFDDIRIFPFDGSMMSYVYDPVSLRLVAELDERNYAKFYEYDEEGKLVRVKKETELGIKTIQENRENSSNK